MSVKPPRKRAQAMAQGRGASERLIVPLALAVAAQISARPLEEFFHDPTQLANGLLELQRAIAADGITVALGGDLERASASELELAALTAPGTRVAAALEATRRLRATLGDGVALLAGLSGPAQLAQDFGRDVAHAGVVFAGLVKEFCVAGADIVLCLEPPTLQPAAAWLEALNTAGNIARFHRALPCLWGVAGPYPTPVAIELNAPVAVATGLITTAAEVPANASIETLRAWVSILASH
jgi:hypothetical protein